MDRVAEPLAASCEVTLKADGRSEIYFMNGEPGGWWGGVDFLKGVLIQRGNAVKAVVDYDADENPQRISMLDKSGKLVLTAEISLDQKGNVTEIRQYGHPSEPFRSHPGVVPDTKVEFAYNEKNQVISTRSLILDYEVGAASMTYDAHGNVASEQRAGQPPARYEYEYEYDQHGNWIRRRIHYHLGTDEIRRDITYFEST